MPHSRRSAMFWAPARLPAFTPPAHRRATGGNSREPAHQLHRHDRDALAPAKLPGHRDRGALVAGRKMPPYRLGDRNGGINSWPRRHLGEVRRDSITIDPEKCKSKTRAGYYDRRPAHRRSAAGGSHSARSTAFAPGKPRGARIMHGPDHQARLCRSLSGGRRARIRRHESATAGSAVSNRRPFVQVA